MQSGLSIVSRIRRWSQSGRPLILAVYAIAALSLAQEPASDFEGHLRLGRYFLENDAAGRAVSEFETAIRLAPERAEAHYNLGNALRLWGDSSGAEKALRKALEIQPRFPEAHFVLGLLLGDRVGSEHLGLSEFEAAIAQKPNYSEAHFNSTAESFTGKEATPNELWQRFDALQKRILNPPRPCPARTTLAHLDQVMEAIAELKRAVALNPDSFETHYQLGRTLLKQNENKRLHKTP